jgi:uncharacterized protein with von Willebrand factor type A (vWA) domain
MNNNNNSDSKSREELSQSPRSWAEILIRYRVEKALPCYGKELPIIHRQTRDKSMIWREKQRALNPVLQSFLDPQMESKYKTMEEATRMKKEKMPRPLSQYSTNFNIITLESTSEQAHKLKSEPNKKLLRNPNKESCEGKDLIDTIPKKKRFPTKTRTFNPVYCLYYENNEEQMKKDMEKEKEMVLNKMKRQQERPGYIGNIILQNEPLYFERIEKMNKTNRKRRITVKMQGKDNTFPGLIKLTRRPATTSITLE